MADPCIQASRQALNERHDWHAAAVAAAINAADEYRVVP